MEGIKIDVTALKYLESEFQHVLNSLKQDEKFIDFKWHYEELLQWLKDSHNREKELS